MSEEGCVTMSLISGRSRVVTMVSMVCILATIMLKMSLLVFSVRATNSVYVTLVPPQYEESCRDDILTILTGASTTHYYYKMDTEECKDVYEKATSFLANQTFYYNVNQSQLQYCFKDKTEEDTIPLIGDKDVWFRVSNHSISSHNDDGYQLYYYYCGDLSSYLDYPWLPLLMWTLLNILPSTLLAILCNIRNVSIFMVCPGFLIAPIISFFVVCPTRRDKKQYVLSRGFSVCVMILGLVTLATSLHLVTAGFGQGDGRHLRYVLPLLTTIPTYLATSLLTTIVLCVGKSSWMAPSYEQSNISAST